MLCPRPIILVFKISINEDKDYEFKSSLDYTVTACIKNKNYMYTIYITNFIYICFHLFFSFTEKNYFSKFITS